MEGSETIPDIGPGKTEEAGAAADGDVILLLLELSQLALDMVELGVEVVIALDFHFEAPISGEAGLLHDVGEDRRVGGDAVDKPGWEGVRDRVGDERRLSIQLVEIDAVLGAAKGALDEAGTGDTVNVTRLEADPVFFDIEVGDSAHVFLEVGGALALWRRSSAPLQLLDMLGELADDFVHT